MGPISRELLSKSFLKKEKLELIKLGPIIMSPGYSFNKSHDKYLCAFDISPFRNSLDEITEPSIIKAKYIIKFLNDIIDISQKQNLNIYLKMKEN